MLNIENIDKLFEKNIKDVDGRAISSDDIVIDNDFFKIFKDNFEILLDKRQGLFSEKIIYLNVKDENLFVCSSWSEVYFSKFIKFIHSSREILVKIILHVDHINDIPYAKVINDPDDNGVNKYEKKIITLDQIKKIKLLFNDEIYNVVINNFGVKKCNIFKKNGMNYFFYKDSACYRNKIKFIKRLNMIVKNAHNRNLNYPLLSDYFYPYNIKNYITLKNNFIL